MRDLKKKLIIIYYFELMLMRETDIEKEVFYYWKIRFKKGCVDKVAVCEFLRYDRKPSFVRHAGPVLLYIDWKTDWKVVTTPRNLFDNFTLEWATSEQGNIRLRKCFSLFKYRGKMFFQWNLIKPSNFLLPLYYTFLFD